MGRACRPAAFVAAGGLFREVVEPRRHGHVLAVGRDQGQVHGRAPVVLGPGNRFAVLCHGLGHPIFIGHEAPEFLLDGKRPVAVEHLEPESLLSQIGLDLGQPFGHVGPQEAAGRRIDGDMGEVVRRGVADIQPDVRDGLGDVHQTGGFRGAGAGGPGRNGDHGEGRPDHPDVGGDKADTRHGNLLSLSSHHALPRPVVKRGVGAAFRPLPVRTGLCRRPVPPG